MKTIIEYLKQAEKNYGEKIAVIEENRTCTYDELVNGAKRIGTAIISKTSVRKPVPVLMEKGINALSVFFGAVFAGDYYVFLNPDLPENRLKDIFEILESDILITDKDHLEIASKISDKYTLFEDINDTQIDENKLEAVRKQSMSLDPLYVNFTSGSTGKPKGVVVDNKSVIEFIEIFTDKFAPFFKKENRIIISREENNFENSADLKTDYLKKHLIKGTTILVDDDIRVIDKIKEEVPEVKLYKDTCLVD